ncbi:preferentially expressed antigen in melanoma-like protein 1 [Chionomys nivalis]|uniref:preferentially expressed antigen in melanoma-like protein 1 n=1 Tax=Chionomys nivalis TaxID=269649 RepID=UPI00259A6BA2|nr:preferentially expressed antigen in melanoma-like protein 1 [Chionomys nivalis]
MSFKSPLTLQELAENSLLRSKTVAISNLDNIPSVFFPSLFKKACRKKKFSIVKAMVQAWPFPCLPLGAMIKRGDSYRRILEIILFGLDSMLCQKVPHRRCKLKVLDLRIMPLKMWDKWSVFKAPDCSENQAAVGLSETEVKPQVKVAIDLVLQERLLKSLESFVVEWVAQREGLCLCCKKLEIWSLATFYHKDVLRTLDLNSVQELHLYNMNDLTCLLNFSPYLGRMRYLRSLLLSSLWPWACRTPAEKQLVTQFTLQFVKLKHLQALHLENVFFLEDHLEELFWCLKTPLETLSVTNCLISNSDWANMAEFPCTSQLKHLSLKRVKLTHFSPEPLQTVLRKSASTLLSLDLEHCRLLGCHRSAVLSSLRCCTQLRWLNICGNHFSGNFLRELLDDEITLRSEGSTVVIIPGCDDLSPEL